MNLPMTPDIPRGTPLGLPTGKELFNADSTLKTLPKGADLVYDDGEPMETPWHRDEMILLIDSLRAHWHDRDDFYVGGNMFVYFSDKQVFNRDFRGPDFFVVKGVDRHRERFCWVTWEENGRFPDVIVELISATTAKVDRGEKKDLYRSVFRTSEYFCYDPVADRLEGWRLNGQQKYVSIPEEPGGRMLSRQLNLYLGRWNGSYLDTQARYLRFFTRGNELVPTFYETAVASSAAEGQKRADAEAAGRVAAEAKAHAAEAELARLKRELEALRQQVPPTAP